MRPPIKYAQSELGVSNTATKRVYCTSIFTHLFNFVKQNIKRILRSFRSGATPRHFQGISDIDGEQVRVTLEETVVSIVDKQGGTARFSAYLVPEMRASLLEIEKKFGRRFTR